MKTTSKDYLLLHFIVFIWGFTAILGALVTIPSVELVFYRTLFAFLSLLVILYIKKKSFKLGRGDFFKILGVGVIIAVHWITFFAAIKISTVSVCLAGLATTSFWTSFLEPLICRTKLKWYEVALGVVVIGGLYIIFKFEFNHKMGLFLGIFSGFFGALFSVINGRFVDRHDPYVITFYEMLGAFLGTVVMLPLYYFILTEGLSAVQLMPTGMDIVYIGLLALVCTVYPFAAAIELMKRLSVFTINLTVNLEPIYGIILAIIILGAKETMSSQFYIGTAIILASVIIHPILNHYYKRRKERLERQIPVN